MTTNKKHIAVYLTPAVEQALIAFCERKGLKSRKGIKFSAGVNTALADFFGVSDIEESTIPQVVDNISQDSGNILNTSSNIPYIPSRNILDTPDITSVESFGMEVMPGKLQA
jgi:hypothetical protein